MRIRDDLGWAVYVPGCGPQPAGRDCAVKPITRALPSSHKRLHTLFLKGFLIPSPQVSHQTFWYCPTSLWSLANSSLVSVASLAKLTAHLIE